jgi:hypothetical protein
MSIKWEFLSEFTDVQQFSQFFHTEELLKTRLLTSSFRLSKGTTVKEGAKSANPRKSKSLDAYTFPVVNAKEKIHMTETLYCKGQDFTSPLASLQAATEKRQTKEKKEAEAVEKTENEKKADEEKQKEAKQKEEEIKNTICTSENCTFQAKWALIENGEGRKFIVYRSGRHCELFNKGPIRRDLPLQPEVRQTIEEYYHLHLTPSKAFDIIATKAKFKGIPVTDISQYPPLKKIQDVYGNLRKNRQPDVTETSNILLKKIPELREYEILFPKNEVDMPQPPNNWLIVLSSPKLLDALRKYGQDKIHIDSIFKLTAYRVPVWSVKKKKNFI